MLNGSQVANRPIIAFLAPPTPLVPLPTAVQDRQPSAARQGAEFAQQIAFNVAKKTVAASLDMAIGNWMCRGDLHAEKERQRKRERESKRERGLVSPALVIALNESWAGQKERLVEFVAAIQDAATAISMLRWAQCRLEHTRTHTEWRELCWIVCSFC